MFQILGQIGQNKPFQMSFCRQSIIHTMTHLFHINMSNGYPVTNHQTTNPGFSFHENVLVLTSTD